jgi:hypothetical protein
MDDLEVPGGERIVREPLRQNQADQRCPANRKTRGTRPGAWKRKSDMVS